MIYQLIPAYVVLILLIILVWKLIQMIEAITLKSKTEMNIKADTATRNLMQDVINKAIDIAVFGKKPPFSKKQIDKILAVATSIANDVLLSYGIDIKNWNVEGLVQATFQRNYIYPYQERRIK